MVETLKYASVGIKEVMDSKLRLEANVFNVESRKAKEVLKNCKWEILPLKEFISKCFYGGRGKRNYVSKYAKGSIGFLGSSEMLEVRPNPNNYVSAVLTNIKPFQVAKGTILISRSGTIGNVTLINKTLAKYLISEHAIRIIPKEYEGYVYTYLRSDIGSTIVQSNTYGAVILQIEPEHLETVPIPNASKEIKQKIHDLVMESFELRDKSNDKIDEAESILVKALKLPPIEQLKPAFYDKGADVRTFSVNLNTLNNRFDASYHNPLVSSILDCFFDNAESIKPLHELSKEITMPGIFKRIYVSADDGVPFLGTNDILELNPKIEKFLSKKGHKNLIEKQLSVKENTILITDRGTIGNVAIVPEYYEKGDWTISQNSIRIVPKSIDLAGYIYIFLNSDYGKVLSKRETYGAVIDMIDPHNTAQIPLPILKNKSLMKEINDLALQANKLKSEAYYKEQEAISIMSNEVLFKKDGKYIAKGLSDAELINKYEKGAIDLKQPIKKMLRTPSNSSILKDKKKA